MRDPVERLECLLEMLALDRRLGSHDRRLDLGVLVPGLAGLQVRRVDAEPLGDPGQGLRRGPRLAPLDLAYVLLREPVAGQV